MSEREAVHGRATYQMQTGRVPGGPIQYPAMGAVVAKELETEGAELPGFVSIAPFRFLSPGAYESGFLGPQYAPLIVGESSFGGPQQGDPDQVLKVEDLHLPEGVTPAQADARVRLLDDMEKEFLAQRSTV